MGPLDRIGQALLGVQRIFAPALEGSEPVRAAQSRAERLRLRCISEAIVSFQFGLASEDLEFILAECEHPARALTDAFSQQLDPKGFWRIDKQVDPELRLSVLSMVAFRDLLSVGIETFLNQNDGEGWMLPESLCLADYGLGRDDRSQVHQVVAARLGPRFLASQATQDPDRLRRERRADAELIRRIVPLADPTDDASSAVLLAAEEPAVYKQGGLF